MSDADYGEALRVLESARNMIERSPSTFRKLDEEELRDLLLVSLNTQFEGQAGGELFNGEGKTDILIRVDDRNVFIGECKFWSGQKAFGDAVAQLLSYLVWRDTKAALLLFIRRQDVTTAIEKAAEVLERHDNCKRVVPSNRPNERRDFVFHTTGDPSRDIHLALLPYAMPSRSDPM